MTNVVISQSMFFPWVGLLEQVALADIWIHYNDVSFSKGSFVNRVQIKTSAGPRWMTLPLAPKKQGQTIQTIQLAPPEHWQRKHLQLLHHSFAGAPFAHDALNIVEEVYAQKHTLLSELSRASLVALCDYFRIAPKQGYLDSNQLQIGGSGSQRVLDLVKAVEGNTYITGHGARAYLAHEDFEAAGISVCYMQYSCMPYPQLHGPFTPYVSGLDLVANCGNKGRQYIGSETIIWRKFLKGKHSYE